MQLYITNPAPNEAAKQLFAISRRRALKQIIENLQMLAVYCEQQGIPLPIKVDGTRYRPSHKHHPVTKWVCESLGNASWTFVYTMFLLNTGGESCGKQIEKFLQWGSEVAAHFGQEGDDTPVVHRYFGSWMPQGCENSSVYDQYFGYLLEKLNKDKGVRRG